MRIGGICSGVGVLEAVACELFGASVAWHCEFDTAPSKVLAHHWPDVPNLGDITTVDLGAVEPIDLLTAGWPCQPWSVAGKQKGAADERAIWPHIGRAIRILRPRHVLLENVPNVVALGELGRVADTLAAIGYDLAWTCVRASDVGAAHRRERLFILATDTARNGRNQGGTESTRIVGRSDASERSAEAAPDSRRDGCEGRQELDSEPSSGIAGTQRADSDRRRDPGLALLPTPTTRGHKGHNQRRDDSCLPGALLPTPQASDGLGGKVSKSLGGTRPSGAKRAIGLSDVAKHRLLPTPTATQYGNNQSLSPNAAVRPSLDGTVRLLPTPEAKLSHAGPDHARVNRKGSGGHDLATAVDIVADWGEYAAAITRQEATFGRLAPEPTEPNTKGNPRLSARFAEWLMAWPEGWVTDPAIGLTRSEQLKAIGNGVVPPQAVAAFRYLLGLEVAA